MEGVWKGPGNRADGSDPSRSYEAPCEPIAVKTNSPLRAFAFERSLQKSCQSQRNKKLMEGLQPKVGKMLGVSWSASPSCPRDAEQHQSQTRESIWMPSDPEPRKWDPRHEPGLGRVSLDLDPAWKG